MSNWYVVLAPVSGRLGNVTIEADEAEVALGGHLILKQQDGKTVAAVAPGSWVSVERELDTQHTTL